MKVRDDFQAREALTKETIAWLDACHKRLQLGMELQADPFYKRTALLGPDVVDGVLASMDDLFISEAKKFPGYHANAQGVSLTTPLVPPRFSKLSHPQKLAIVQGIDRIFQKFRVDDTPTPPPEETPIAY